MNSNGVPSITRPTHTYATNTIYAVISQWHRIMRRTSENNQHDLVIVQLRDVTAAQLPTLISMKA